MTSFSGKTAIITGAAQGIGRAAAHRLARDGARVALIDRVPEACEKVRNEIASAGGDAVAIDADLETKTDVDMMITRVIAAFDTIDIAVHNVGGTIWTKPFWEYQDDEIEKEISRSLWPTLRCCRAVIP